MTRKIQDEATRDGIYEAVKEKPLLKHWMKDYWARGE